MPGRILLVSPPFWRLFKDNYCNPIHPLALGYLSAVILRDTDWEVMSYNADFHDRWEIAKLEYIANEGFANYVKNLHNCACRVWVEVMETIKDYRPDIIGITASAPTFASAEVVAKLAKEINKNTKVVMGGPHPSNMGPVTLACSEIDFCIRGEGEVTIVELLKALEGKKTLHDINGICYRRGTVVIENPPRTLIDNLDNLPFPHAHVKQTLKNWDKYPKKAFQTIFATRGCPHNCLFCSSRKIWTRRVRSRSPQNVVNEIRDLRKLGIDNVYFTDDTFGQNRQYLESLCRAIKDGCPDTTWSCQMHVKSVNEESIAIMRKAGCTRIQLGIESGNNEILRRMRKGITIEEAMAAAETIRRQGIRLELFFMVGFPNDTEETIGDTVEAMKQIRCDEIIYAIFTPHPGSDAFEFCMEKGLIPDDYDISKHLHQSPMNYFCMNIGQRHFREILGEVERIVDRQNRRSRIRRALSPYSIREIRQIGVLNSVRLFVQTLWG